MSGRKIKILMIYLSVVFLLRFVVYSELTSQEKNPVRALQQNAGPGSLIKKDRLPVLEPSLSSVRRDIFRPSSLAVAPVKSAQDWKNRENALVEGKAGESPALLNNLDIAYLGMAVHGSKKVALIELNGEPLILSEGEEILFSGLKLVRITPEEIIIKDDRDNSRKIRLKET